LPVPGPAGARLSLMYRNREDAARQLAKALMAWRGKRPIIYAIPRGAVPIGRLIQQQLDGELDVVLVHKLGAPGNPEFAIGAVAESGWKYVDDRYGAAGASDRYLADEAAAQLQTLHRRREQYACASIPATGRIAIVVDDGLATGATMIAALHALRAQQPQRLICAVPVASRDSLEKVRPLADEVVCLSTPADFYAVGQFYETFGQVDDEQVIRDLKAAREPEGPA
jgi:putative phosphoribosyl transferase